MSRPKIIFAAVALGLTLAPTGLLAECKDQPREVALDKDNVVVLRSYLCTTGTDTDSAQFRVEYYRLSDGAVSLLLANGSSIKLRKTLGPAKIMPNEVAQTYADLVKKFGITADVPKNNFLTGDLSFTVMPADETPSAPDIPANNAGDQNTKDKTGLKQLRTLIGLWGAGVGDDYPAIAEISALQNKTIPTNLGYYYSFSGAAKDYPDASCDKQDFTCKKFGDDIYQMLVWRPLSVVDIDNFGANAKAYNARMLQVRKDKTAAKVSFVGPGDPASNYDSLVKFISSGGLPDDFSFLLGRYQPSPECGDASPDGDLPGLAGWKFNTVRRNVKIDAVFVENVSKQPLVIGQLLGYRNANADLRVAESESASPANATPLDATSGTIAPGQTAIILTRILFLLPPDQLTGFRKDRQSMDALRTAFGAGGFGGNISAYRVPNPKDYTFGPTLNVTGVLINSKRIDFAARSARNFLELTASQEGASCPYLLSWDDSKQEWISDGKILEKGQGQNRAYTEIVTFPDLRTHFRIEEREPEFAHVQDVKLIIELRNGSTQTFSPVRSAVASDSGEVNLMWGEAADFVFAVPDTVHADDVAQTRLEITGFYERYSNLLAEKELRVRATTLPVRVNTVK